MMKNLAHSKAVIVPHESISKICKVREPFSKIGRNKTTLLLNSKCTQCLGGHLILNDTTDTLK